MAEATVNIKVTELEPFARFVRAVVEVDAAFCDLSGAALSEKASEAVAKLHVALEELSGNTPSPVYARSETIAAQHTMVLHDLGERTLEQMLREQATRPPRRTG